LIGAKHAIAVNSCTAAMHLALEITGLRLASPGPIFYKATRVGKGGRPFRMYKFRTMRDGNGPRVTANKDPCITEIGRFLRKTKLNELPQLFNVLKGEISPALRPSKGGSARAPKTRNSWRMIQPGSARCCR